MREHFAHDIGQRLAAKIRMAHPARAARRGRVRGVVTHAFTHFPLELVVYVADVPAHAAAPRGARWVRHADLGGEALPNVMRKVLVHALG